MDEKKESLSLNESRWQSNEINRKGRETVALGIDVGSVSSQAVILLGGELYAYSSIRTGFSSPESASGAADMAMEGTGLTLRDMHCIIGTGYGRTNIPFADRNMTEIACHARGVIYMYGSTVRTILDMGGQDCKVIHCDGQGRVLSFLMNDKCAAGTGRGVEVFAELLGIPIEEVGRRSLMVDEEPAPVSSTCVVFAKSEAIGLLRSGWSTEKVLAAYFRALADRVVLLLKRAGMKEDFAITGGIAKNEGVVSRIEKQLGVKSLTPVYDTQIAGALGAALFAETLAKKTAEKN